MEANFKPMRQNLITIVSMDGGGVRGVIPAVVLNFLEKLIQELEHDKNARIVDYFDIVAGTSAGGVNASLLTAPDEHRRPKYTTDEIVKFNMTQWREIFPPISDSQTKELQWINYLVEPMYQNKNFCHVMDKMLPNARLSDTVTNVVIPSFDIKKMQPIIFSTHEAKVNQTDNAPLKHVTVATCSAPIAFPPYYFEDRDTKSDAIIEYNVIDGYVVADNPTWVAVTEGLKEYTEKHGKSTGTICKLLILSLGTGSPPSVSQFDAKNTSTWGTIQWLYSMQNRCRPYNDIFKAAASNLVDIQLRCFLKAVGCTENYLRVQPPLTPDEVAVTNSSEENMEKLKKLAEDFVKQKAGELKEFAKKLVCEKHFRKGSNSA